jgi:hypothetical protein
MEMRMSGQCVYAILLADTVVQEIGNENLTKEKKKPQACRLGLCGAGMAWDAERWDPHQERLPHR